MSDIKKCGNTDCILYSKWTSDHCGKMVEGRVVGLCLGYTEAPSKSGPSGSNSTTLLGVAKVKKEKTPSGWEQPYVSLRILNFEFKRIYHTEDGAKRCAEKINKLLASST